MERGSGEGCLLRGPRLCGWSAPPNRVPGPPPPASGERTGPPCLPRALLPDRGFSVGTDGGPHPRRPRLGRPAPVPAATNFCGPRGEAGSSGTALGRQLRAPRRRAGQTQRLPKQQRHQPPSLLLAPSISRRLPSHSPHARVKGGWQWEGRWPAPQLCRNGAKLFRLHPGSPARPGRSPAKPNQPLINHVRYFVHHTSRHLIQGQQRKEGGKKSLNANPAKPVFLFSLWLTQKNAPREVVADSFLKEEGGEKSP